MNDQVNEQVQDPDGYNPTPGMVQITESTFESLITDKKLLREALSEVVKYANGFGYSPSADAVFSKAEFALEATK